MIIEPKTLEELMDMTYKSRKFVLTLIGLSIFVGFSTLSIWFTSISSILPTLVGGVIGVLSLYFTGNIANKYVVGKAFESEKVGKGVVVGVGGADTNTDKKSIPNKVDGVQQKINNQVEDKTASA